jgi:3-hydroxymyristoyl/3-hydroxydecanoyl-(acyl carrier protein) dehydratase
MRWYFIDRIESFIKWKSITALKAVSFEEFHLLEKQGRQGVLPESLLLETCVEALRWLIVRSSEFQLSSALHAVDAFKFCTPACCGDVLRVTATIEHRSPEYVSAFCTVSCPRINLAEGKISVETMPLDLCFDPSLLQGIWKELHGQA